MSQLIVTINTSPKEDGTGLTTTACVSVELAPKNERGLADTVVKQLAKCMPELIKFISDSAMDEVGEMTIRNTPPAPDSKQ